MKLSTLTNVALVVMTLGPLAQAQTGTEPKKQEPQATAKTIPASMRLTKVKADLTIPATGVTAENAAKLKTSLEALNSHIYSCAACSERFSIAGTCPGCQANLKEESKPIFSQVTVAPDSGAVKFQTNEGMQVRLSDIERAFKAGGASIDNQKLTIGGNATLYVAGATSDEAAANIQKALQEGKLFQRASAAIDPLNKQARIFVSAGSTAPSRANIDAALAKVDANYKITEVIWNANSDETEKK
jgi:hypothetical protein